MWRRIYAFDYEKGCFTWCDVQADDNENAADLAATLGWSLSDIFHVQEFGPSESLVKYESIKTLNREQLTKAEIGFVEILLRNHTRALKVARLNWNNGRSFAQLNLPF